MQKFDLTESQLSIWASQKLHQNVPLHNVAHTFEISGPIDSKVFQMAFEKLVDGILALRTVFFEDNGIPYQKFKEEVVFEVPLIDFSDSMHSESSVDDWVSERAKRIFKISEKNFDTALLHIETDRYIWFLNLHHLITDGATTSLLFAKMNELYSGLLLGEPVKVAELSTYADYITFEKEQRRPVPNDTHQAFWKNKSKGLNGSPRLYGAKIDITSTDATRFRVPLGKELTSELKKLAKKPEIRGWTEDSTLFNIFSSLFYSYLHRISGHKKIALGVTVHNRTFKKFRATAGLFIEVFPFTNEIFEDDTFYSLFQRVKSEINVFLKNSKPGTLDPELARNSNVMLNYIMTKFGSFNGYPVKSEWIYPGHMSSAHQVELHVTDFDDSKEVELLFDINNLVLSKEDRGNAPNHFLNLIHAFINNMQASIYEPSLISDKELEQVNCVAQKVNKDFVSVLEKFENQVIETSDDIALVHENSSLTYQELNSRANQFAHYLKSQNIGPGSLVILVLKRTPEYVISVLSTLKTGAAYVPIPPNYPEERIKYIVEDSRAKLLIGSTETLDAAAFKNIKSVVIDSPNFSLANFSKLNLSNNISSNQTAFLIYTSGSTGKPKGIKISHGALSNYIDWTAKTYIDIDCPAIPLFTSVGFDITANSVFLPLICGGSIHVYTETDVHSDLAILDVIQENKVDFVKLTPAHLSFLKGKQYKENKIRVMVVTGDEFKTDLAQNIYDAFGGKTRIFNEYGPAEATIGCIYHEFTPNTKSPSVPIGLPITNMEAYVLDEFKNPVPKGVVGEIYLAGVGLADGYWEKPELTKEKFVSNPFREGAKMYRTQDLARINENGILEFLGRRDFQVKINGHRIELGEIEAQISDFKSIKGCVVVLDERNNLKNLAAYFISTEEVHLHELQSHLTEKLPRFMIPLYFKRLKEFPLSPNGKIDRKKLGLIDAAAIEGKTEFVAPRNEIEEILAKIWSEIFGLAHIGVKDDFIVLGGHSLLAIRITAQINEEIEMNFPITKVFEYPTIEMYSNFIEKTLIELLNE